MLSIPKLLIFSCVLFLQLSSSAVIGRYRPQGIQIRTPTALDTAALPLTLTDRGWPFTSQPDDDDDDSDEQQDDDDSSDEQQHDNRNQGDDGDQNDEDNTDDADDTCGTADEGDTGDYSDGSTDGDNDDSGSASSSTLPSSPKSHSIAPKPTISSFAIPTAPAPTKNHTSAPQPTTLTSIAVILPTLTTSVSAQPKVTTLSTVIVVPVPKTSSPAIQPSVSTSRATPSLTTSGDVWKPTAGTTWQIQLSGTVSDLTYPVDVFDVDLFDTPLDTINKLKADGKKVMCYFSAGSYEDWRPDQASFLPSDKGSPLEGWPGEFWLNTSSTNVRSIMATRIQMAKDKACDGVDPDNVDGYDNTNGLSLSPATAADFVKYLSQEAHSRGLSMGLKNAGDIINEVLPFLEWQVNEECVQYDDCGQLAPFITQNKPVFHIEYPDGAPNLTPDVKTTLCNAPSAKGFSTLLKKMNLDDWVDPCT
jgi:hypothetical protein